MAERTGYACSPAELAEAEEAQLQMELQNHYPTEDEVMDFLQAYSKMKCCHFYIQDFIRMLGDMVKTGEEFETCLAIYADKYKEEINRWLYA